MKRIHVLILLSLLAYLTGCVSSTAISRKVSLDQAAEYNAKMGAGYLAQGNYILAKQKLDKALEQNPDLAEAHAVYALLEGQIGRVESAERHFKIALDEEPHNSKFLNNYGTFLCGQNRILEAEEKFMAALNDPLYTTPEYAYTNAGSCALRIPDHDKAEGYLRKALQINPNFSGALYELSRLNVKRHKYHLAKSYLDRYHSVVGVNGHTAESLWFSIELARKLSDKNAEASYALLLKKRFPDSSQAQNLK